MKIGYNLKTWRKRIIQDLEHEDIYERISYEKKDFCIHGVYKVQENMEFDLIKGE